jgi:cold shock protein
MSRYKTYREPRRRGFDDDNYSPRDRDRSSSPSYSTRAPAEPSPSTDATVTWFNPDKGFGFVRASDGSEAFLHIRPLEAAGHSTVPEGARLKVRIGPGQKGPQVTDVLEMDLSAVPASSPTGSARSSRQQSPSEGPDMKGEGSVKWYNAEKRFGFIGLDGAAKDVFVHATAVERSGLTSLSDGQKVAVKYVMGKKGPEARSVQPID